MRKGKLIGKHRVRGNTLAYTLMVILLISIVISGMIMLPATHNYSNNAIYYEELAMDNMESARNLLFYGKNIKFGDFEQTLFDSEIDSYKARIAEWGMWGSWWIEGRHGPSSYHQEGLLGTNSSGLREAGLYLKDNHEALTLVGNARLSGKLYLPEAGLKRGYLGREGFSGEALHSGTIQSSKQVPFSPTYENQNQVKSFLQKCEWSQFSGKWRPLRKDTIRHSFKTAPMVLSSTQPVQLSNISIHGNVILNAPEVYVGRGADLSNLLIFARYIRIDKGFEGKLQAFASDSMDIEEDVYLHYPSSLVVGASDERGFLTLGRNTIIEGVIINDSQIMQAGTGKFAYTLIDDGALIEGEVVVRTNLELKGQVKGFVFTEQFLLRTSGSVNENYLKDAIINPAGRDPYYRTALFGGPIKQFSIVSKEWGLDEKRRENETN